MNNHIDFYFDFISPYSYIAYKKILKILKTKKIIFNYKPILLGGLHNLAEINPPAFNKYKLQNMRADCELVAKKNNIDFSWNSKFPINSLRLMRGYLYIEDNKKEIFLNKFFNAFWKDNVDLSIDEKIIDLLKVMNINNQKFFKGIEDQSIKNNLKKLTTYAFNKNVFGAPTFIVNNKIFWGQDRLEYALDEMIDN